MNIKGQYAYTPHILPSALAVLFLISLAVYGWRKRGLTGARVFSVSCLFASLWVAGYTMEAAAVDMATKIFWFKVQSACSLPTATAITCFILEYAWPGRWLTRRNLFLLSIPLLISLGIIVTNNFHHLAWYGFLYDKKIIPIRGPDNWFFFIYGYALGVVSIIVLVWLYYRSPQHRWPVALMLAGQITGRGLYLLNAIQVQSSELLIDTPPVTLEFLMYAIALFGFHLFDPVPLARQAAISQMHAGLLVLDRQGQVVSLNPAAERILGLRSKQIMGKPIKKLLPAYPDGFSSGLTETEVELSLGEGPELRNYILVFSTLHDFRGLEVGRLLMLRDVTEQKRTQAQALEQQRALAMLHEREQLARELHDSLGQVLGYASLKMGATRKLIADGKLAKADDQLAHLESSLTEAHADVREYILNLRTAPTGGKPFLSTLRNYLDGFHQNYSIHVDVSVGSGVNEDVFAVEVQIQLFRILQEALSNARKYAATNYVNVSFEMENDRVCMRVRDNGKGFDPLQAAGAGSGHFGLSFMRERAESLGGSLRVKSVLGEGTCVEVEVPVHGKTETM